MNARETLDAARAAWERSQPQLFMELEDPAPDSDDGSADAPTSDPPVAGRHPGPDTHPVSDGLGPQPPALPIRGDGGVSSRVVARVDTEAGLPLVGGTIGASPCSVARPNIPGPRPPASTTQLNGDGRATLGEEAAVAGGDSNG